GDHGKARHRSRDPDRRRSPMTPRSCPARRGVTLVEVVILLAVCLALLGAVMEFMAGSQAQSARTMQEQEDLAGISLVLDHLHRDLRQALPAQIGRAHV